MKTEAPAGLPNVILLMADQLRADALGCMGNAIIRTPHLDRIARDGVVFDRAFTNCPVCMASRGSIHTGRYPDTLRMRSMGILLPEEITLAETLRKAGYRTGLFGKLHFLPMEYTRDVLKTVYEQDDVGLFLEACGALSAGTRAASEDPFKRHYGFEVSCGVNDINRGHYLDWLQKVSPGHVAVHESENWPSGLSHTRYGQSPPAKRMFLPEVTDFFDSNLPAELHPSHFIVEKAIEFIRGNHERPFFAHVSFIDPHHPFNAPVGFKENYRPEDMPAPARHDPDLCFPPDLPPNMTALNRKYASFPDELFRWALANYYGMISHLDAEVGRLLDELSRLGILDDTLIVFTSDHGEHVGDHGLMYKGAQIFDGLMRVPLMYRWGGGLPGGRRASAMVEEVDIYPTIMSLLGFPIHPGVQGADRTEVLRGASERGRERVLCALDGQPGKAMATTYAIRTDTWKLIHYPEAKTGMLFDLEADPGEHVNRYHDPSCVDMRHRMMQELVDEIARQKDPLPLRLSSA